MIVSESQKRGKNVLLRSTLIWCNVIVIIRSSEIMSEPEDTQSDLLPLILIVCMIILLLALTIVYIPRLF